MAQNQICKGVATKVAADYGQCAVQYHGTTVAERQGDTITLNSAGWRSATTKLRMNQFSNQFLGSAFCVYQKKGVWFVSFRDGRDDVEFFDGVTFDL